MLLQVLGCYYGLCLLAMLGTPETRTVLCTIGDGARCVRVDAIRAAMAFSRTAARTTSQSLVRAACTLQRAWRSRRRQAVTCPREIGWVIVPPVSGTDVH